MRRPRADRCCRPSFSAATGLLWAPCAGPVLGLVLTTAALQGASARTSLLLLAYAAGAATSLALALWVGGRVFLAMKSLGVGEWLRRGLGVAVLAGVTAVALGWIPGCWRACHPAADESEHARIPTIGAVPDYDLAMIGVPFDGGTSYRPGARFGPMGVREASRLLRPGYHPELETSSPCTNAQVVDAGDIAVHP